MAKISQQPTGTLSEESSNPANPSASPCPANGSSPTPCPTECSSSSPATTTAQPPSPRFSHPPTLAQARLIPINRIRLTDELNGRLALDHDKVHALAQNIAQHGLLHPITLRQHNDELTLIAGRHRLAAYRRLARNDIPAIILHVDDLSAGTLRLAENTNRCTLSPVEEAKQLADLVPLHPDGVAHDTGRSVPWILDRLDMIEWPDYLLQAVHEKNISLAAAKELARITNDDHRHYLVDQAAQHGVTAPTARYWRQQAEMQNFEPDNMPEKASQNAISGIKTIVTAACFVCREDIDITTTVATRVCTSCLSEIQKTQTQQPPEQRPPPR